MRNISVRKLAAFLAAILALQGIYPAVPVLAETLPENGISLEETADIRKATPSEALYEEPEEEEEEIEPATPSQAKKAEDVMLTKTVGGIRIVLTADAGTFTDEDGDPIENRKLSLKAVKLTKEEIREYLGIIDETDGEDGRPHSTSDVLFAYDVSVMYEGEEIQPGGPVEVTFEEVEETDECIEVYHISEDMPEKKELSVEEGSVSTQFDHFSPILILKAASIGDLWANWDTVMADFNTMAGSGTESAPYEIENLNQLMALSAAVTAGMYSANGKHYRLMADIDLSNMPSQYGYWHPIGWYQAAASPDPVAFTGTFDGNGYTLSGLDIIDTKNSLKYVGLFGRLENASVKNLTLLADTVNGYDYVGILSGEIRGSSQIHDVVIEGSANAGISVSECADDAKVGAVAGCVNGKSFSADGAAVIENVKAENVNLNATGDNSSVGGICGEAANAYIVDVTVGAESNHGIQGKGYVGGIAGYYSSSAIYNAYVYGTIGGNGSVAAGGMVGYWYGNPQMILCRFAGEIGATNRQVSHEGLFIGTRALNSTLRYGVESNDNASYLFYSETGKNGKICASGMTGDASGVTKEAKVGYWKENELQYVLMEGSNEYPSASGEYFYQALEDGVRHIVVNKLGKKFTVADYAEGLPFSIDHYAPGNDGAPVLGHLLSIPEINAKNPAGTFDQDVAYFTAYPRQNSSYYRVIDKESAAAVAPGEIVNVSTSPKNQGGNYYQMVVNELSEGGVEPPTFLNELGEREEMTYQTGGGYVFTMPDCDTELDVKYVKVASQILLSPDRTSFRIVQTRTGDRKNPVVTTEVFDENNNRISTYEVGKTPENDQVSPFDIEVHFNSVASTNLVTWSIDDTDLLNISKTTSGWTKNNAKVKPEMNSTWMAGLITQAVADQANNSYRTAIRNTVYKKTAVLSATTDPDYSVDNKPVYANCQIEVSFQIVDETYIAVEDIDLSADELEFTVTRALMGDRKKPEENWFVSLPKKLTATLYPDNPLTYSVSWAGDEAAKKAFSFAESENNSHELVVSVRFDENSSDNPAWIQAAINAADEKRKQDPYAKIDGTASAEGVITVTANDTTHGTLTDSCKVKVNFTISDETIIHPEGVEMNPEEIERNLVIEKTGDIRSSEKSSSGFESENITSLVLPNLSFLDKYLPYNRSVTWSVSDTDAVSVSKDGVLSIRKDAKWIQDAQKNAPYTAKKIVYVYCTADDNGKKGATKVTLNYETRCLELPAETKTVNVTLTATGSRSNPAYAFTGTDALCLKADTYPVVRAVTYTSSDTDVLKTDASGNVTFVADRTKTWIADAMKKSPYTASKTVQITASDGKGRDTCTVTVNFKYEDKTYSTSGGSGGGGGGGGSISGGGTSVGSGITKSVTGLPTYVVSGTWVQSADGTWRFTSGRTYTNEWAAVYNPYAVEPQAAFDWFRFDEKSVMVTGWFTDPKDGNLYYLWPVSDNTLGHMVVGCQLIDGTWYYFNEKSDGTRGKLMKSASVKASDGKTIATDEKGRIISVNGRAEEIASLTATPNTTASLRASGVIGTPAAGVSAAR